MIEKILQRIDELRLTQKQVEQACLLPANRITKWKDDQGEPTARQLYRIARFTDTDIFYFLDDEREDPTPFTSEDVEILRFVRAAGLDYGGLVRRLTSAPSAPEPVPRAQPTLVRQVDTGPRLPAELEPPRPRRGKASKPKPVGDDERPDPMDTPGRRRR